MGENSSFNLELWGYVCAGQQGGRSINTKSVFESLIWSGNHIPLCSQWILQAVVHLPLLFSSGYYAGLYYRAQKKGASLITLSILIPTLFLLIFSIINFLNSNLIFPSQNISIVLISSLIVKCLAWLLHSVCVFTLAPSLDRPPDFSIFSWFLVLIFDLIYYISIIILKVHPDWEITIDRPFFQDFFLYTFSFVIFLHIFYAVTIVASYGKVLTRRWRLRNSPSYSLLNVQHSYGSIGTFESELPDKPINEEGVSWMSYLFFLWFNQTIKKGYKKKIESLDDLPSLPPTLRGDYLLAKFNRFYTDRHMNGVKSNKWRLLLSVIQVAGYRFYLSGLLKLIADAVTFTGPLLLNALVYLVENNSQPIYYGYLYALGLFVSSFIGMLLNVHFQYLVDKVNVSIKSAVMNAVYQKVIRLNLSRLNKFSSGEVLDFMSTDAGRLSSVWNVHLFWSMPVMICICLYLLYTQVGLSFLAGLAFCVVIIIINQFLTVQISRVFKKYMECKDERIRLMSEILTGIRVIKLYAWERIFRNKIGKIRSDELRQLAWVKCLDGFCVFFWACTATMMCVLTFITYSLMGNELTAARVFTSVSLFAILIGPLNGFPLVLQWIAEAWVSLARLEKFLSVEELNEKQYYSSDPPPDPKTVLSIRNGEFSWDYEKEKPKESTALNPIERPILKGIDIIVHSKQFVGIVGRVGSGKSSIFSALTMELIKRSGNIYYAHLNEGFGYVSQESWIQHGTLRSNILFGLPYNPDLYERVVSACALLPDFAMAHASDMTEVGENGVNLSGGQKARINLARACYQQKPCILLDDPLSAVDATVAQHIYNNCFLKLLSNTTRILITHRVNLLRSTDLIIEVNDGEIVNIGIPDQILPHMERRCEVVEKEGKGEEGEGRLSLKENPESIELVKKEAKCTGSVKFSIYSSYWRSIGHIFAFLILFSMLLMESSKRGTDVWLSIWTTANISRTPTNTSNTNLSSQKDNSDTLYYLGIYAGLSIATGLVTVFRAASFAIGTFRASKWIHSRLYHRITRATILFFDSTPIGRLLNRFSSDLYTIDFDLPFNLNVFLAQIFSLAGALIITIYGLPLILVLLGGLSIFYFMIQFYYRRTSRELKRIASISMSPVYSHFSETFAGIATIKAMRSTDRFFSKNIANVDRNQQANFTSSIAAGWFRIRIQMITISIVTGVAFFAVIQHQLILPVNPGLLGLALSYAITLTGALGSTIETFTQLEMLMVAVERIDEYTNTTPVEDILHLNHKNSQFRSIFYQVHAPSITFLNVSLRYRGGLPCALNEVSFKVFGGEKLGIVGRTGAGKSSLVRVLFRLVNLSGGKILLDGVDILEYSLEQLRNSLAAIPQDPFLFNGTVRENLSPDTTRYNDEEMWGSLEDAYLRQVVQELGGLDASVGIGGKRFSTGQRQLMCLARAILTKPKLLCIDEATANIDSFTDEQIQTVIQTKFHSSTVITIAHRINTIMHCDKVLVMEGGKVVEHASPQELLNNPDSAFSSLASHSSH